MAKTQIFKNYDEFLNRADKSINGIDARFAEKHGIDLDADTSTVGCWNCVNCTACKDCVNCEDCEDCEGCWSCVDCVACWNCVDCKERGFFRG